jgi:hypothetical protein
MRDAGRRSVWAATAMLVAGTLAVAVTGYSLSVAVSDERREVRRLEARNAELSDLNRALEAELRVRMRLPQLQSWNDGILGLLPITAEQHVASPHVLARFAMPAAGAQTQPTLALMTREAAPQPQPRLVSAPAPSDASPPRAPRAGAEREAPSAAPPPAVRLAPVPSRPPPPGPTLAAREVPMQAAGPVLPPPLPADLLRLVEIEPGVPAP